MKFIVAKAVVSIYLLVRCLFLIIRRKFSWRLCVGTLVIMVLMAMMVAVMAKRENEQIAAAGARQTEFQPGPAAGN